MFVGGASMPRFWTGNERSHQISANHGHSAVVVMLFYEFSVVLFILFLSSISPLPASVFSEIRPIYCVDTFRLFYH